MTENSPRNASARALAKLADLGPILATLAAEATPMAKYDPLYGHLKRQSAAGLGSEPTVQISLHLANFLREGSVVFCGMAKHPSPAEPGSTTTLHALLDGGSDRRFRDLIQALLGISSRFVDLRERIGARVGLTGPQYSMLVSIPYLAGADRGVTVSQLAAHLHVSGTYVTAESKKLEARGEIRREPHPSDRRSVLLQLTPKGRETLDALLPMIRDVNDALFAGLDKAGFEGLREQILRLVPAAADALLVARRHGAARGPSLREGS